MKITIDFENGYIRTYEISKKGADVLNKLGVLKLKIKHPRFAEYCIIETPRKMDEFINKYGHRNGQAFLGCKNKNHGACNHGGTADEKSKPWVYIYE